MPVNYVKRYCSKILQEFKCCKCKAVERVSAFPEKKRYEGVRFNVINVTRGMVGVKFPGKKHVITLEWPHTEFSHIHRQFNEKQNKGQNRD